LANGATDKATSLAAFNRIAQRLLASSWFGLVRHCRRPRPIAIPAAIRRNSDRFPQQRSVYL